ncbi:MAG: endonuclease/exonuclease/phosphatase family protein [Saprospiraceae bacterium]|nr:endonuclease/exonuclease/phosphatase family protein [Saprospiraceae bacterium]
MRQKVSTLIKWSNLLLILITFACYLSPYIHPKVCWPLAILGLTYPFLLFANLGFIFFWILRKHHYFLFSLTTIVLGWTHFQSFVGYHFVADCTSTIKVASFNGYSFRSLGSPTAMNSEQELEKYFPKLDAEILCIQEFVQSRHHQNLFSRFLKKKGYKYKFSQVGRGLAIYSKFPLENGIHQSFGNHANGYQIVDVRIKNQKLRLFNLHLLSNGVSQTADRVASNGNIQKKQTWKDIRFILRNYKRAAQKRSAEAERIARLIDKSPYPIILCGDLNETPQSYAYYLISQNLKDTFKTAGRGLGITYAGSIPALHIDHILVDPKIHVCKTSIQSSIFSDHYPVVSQLKLHQKP